MIDIRKCPKDTNMRVLEIEEDGDDLHFFLTHNTTARVRVDWEDVATALGYSKREIRVEYGDSGEDYIAEYTLEGHHFNTFDYLDNRHEVAKIKLRNHIYEKFNSILS